MANKWFDVFDDGTCLANKWFDVFDDGTCLANKSFDVFDDGIIPVGTEGFFCTKRILEQINRIMRLDVAQIPQRMLHLTFGSGLWLALWTAFCGCAISRLSGNGIICIVGIHGDCWMIV